MATSSSTTQAPHRCLIGHVQAIGKYRLLGAVVSIDNNCGQLTNEKASNIDHNIPSSQRGTCIDGEAMPEECVALLLDDGTGSLPCIVSMAMAERVTIKLGQTFECLGQVVQASADTCCISGGEFLVMKVDTLLEVIQDPWALEQLRWMEILYSQTNNSGTVDTTFGYPCHKISSQDIFDLIQSNQEEGVTVAEIALVLDMEEPQVLALVEELQMQGQVYQNERNCYVPL